MFERHKLTLLVLGAGYLFGFAAWGEGRDPALAVLLGFLVAIAPSRLLAATFVSGYVMAQLRTHPAYSAGWFGGQESIGWLLCSVAAIFSGIVWSVGWSQPLSAAKTFLGQQSRRLFFMLLAWALTLIPPMALLIPGHPMVGLGYIIPGWGWYGVVAGAVVPMFLLLLWFRFSPYLHTRWAVLMTVGLVLGLVGLYPVKPLAHDSGAAIAVNTHFGRIAGTDDSLRVIGQIGQSIRKTKPGTAATYFWPESVIGRYDPAFSSILKLEIANPAAARNQYQVIGMDVKTQDGGFLSTAVAYHPDGSTEIATARQPAPVALWRPWTKESFHADWFAKHDLLLADGRRAAILFCYEEFLPALFLISKATVRPDLFVVMSNTWASPSTVATTIQSAHSIGMSRLFGVPLIRAENRPSKDSRTTSLAGLE